jgi:hypothetical protein
MIKKWLDSYLRKIRVVEQIWYEIGELVSFRGEVQQKLSGVDQKISGVDHLLAITRASFQPVVLFTGTMFLPGGDSNQPKAICDYAWAEKAKASVEAYVADYIVSCQPHCTIKLASIEVLNGPYDIVRCQIANVDLIATMEGVFPPRQVIPVPEDLGTITPANRIAIWLKSR